MRLEMHRVLSLIECAGICVRDDRFVHRNSEKYQIEIPVKTADNGVPGQ